MKRKNNEYVTKNTMDYRSSFVTIVNAFESKINSIGNIRNYTVNPADPTSANETNANIVLNDFEEGTIVYSVKITEIYCSEIEIYQIFPKFYETEFETRIDFAYEKRKPKLKYHLYIEMDAQVKTKGIWSNSGIKIQDRSNRGISAKEHLNFLAKLLLEAKSVDQYERESFVDPMGSLSDYK